MSNLYSAGWLWEAAVRLSVAQYFIFMVTSIDQVAACMPNTHQSRRRIEFDRCLTLTGTDILSLCSFGVSVLAAVHFVARWCFLAGSSWSVCSLKGDEFGLNRAVSVASYVIVVCELHQPDRSFLRGLGFLLPA